jgi:hypothetical protein
MQLALVNDETTEQPTTGRSSAWKTSKVAIHKDEMLVNQAEWPDQLKS